MFHFEKAWHSSSTISHQAECIPCRLCRMTQSHLPNNFRVWYILGIEVQPAQTREYDLRTTIATLYGMLYAGTTKAMVGMKGPAAICDLISSNAGHMPYCSKKKAMWCTPQHKPWESQPPPIERTDAVIWHAWPLIDEELYRWWRCQCWKSGITTKPLGQYQLRVRTTIP